MPWIKSAYQARDVGAEPRRAGDEACGAEHEMVERDRPQGPFPGAGRERSADAGSEVAGELEDGTRVMALTGGGGYAERVAVDRASIVALPERASFAEGAGFLLTYLTAYVPLTRQVVVREGTRVLVHAAAGGVGTASIQVAKALGA